MHWRSLLIPAVALVLGVGPAAVVGFAADPEELPPGPGNDDGKGPTGPLAPGLDVPKKPAGADEIHDIKLRELEEKVVTLKEKVFRSKTRLLLLKERLLNDVIAEAKVVIFHENDMGSSFKPVQVLYHLDGEKIYFQDDASKVLSEKSSIEIYNQNMAPGNHVLAVEMVYRGDSSVFAYLKDYQFKLRSSYTFYATKGKITTVRAIGYQKGDITYDLRDRPSITFDVKQISYTADKTKIEDEKPGQMPTDLPPTPEPGTPGVAPAPEKSPEPEPEPNP